MSEQPKDGMTGISPASGPETAAQHEERVCTCGAGHGSLEGHADWCDFIAYQALPSGADISPENVARMLEGVTQGPWRVDGPPWNMIVWADGENRVAWLAHGNGLNDDRDLATARFIAWAREAVPALAAQLAEVEAERDGLLRAAHDNHEADKRAEAAEAEVTKLRNALARSKRLRDQYREALDAERTHSNPARSTLKRGTS